MDLSPTLTIQQLLLNFIIQWWTPAFFVIFLAILSYALWPKNRANFDHAARLPLRED